MKVLYKGTVMEEEAAKDMEQQEKVLGSFFGSPGQLDVLEAQLAYCAMMTDTLLEV